MSSSLAKLADEFKSAYSLSADANVALSAFTLYVERKDPYMVPFAILNKFNILRALIYASSPQVRERDGYIEILDSHDNAERVAACVVSDSFERIVQAIHKNPLSVSLVVLAERTDSERYAIAERVSIYHAFMLT
jgi:hypothetical protein